MSRKYRQNILAFAANFAVASAAILFVAPDARAGAGDLFATDPTSNTIRVYALDGSTRIFATGLHSPQGLVFDGFGNLFVSDENTGNIYKFTADGTRTIFASGLNQPMGLAFDGTQLAVSENGADTVTRVDEDGTFSVFQNIVNPLGLAFELPNLYVADGTSLNVIDPANVITTFPVAGSRSVAVDGVDNAFVSSSLGTITKVTPTGISTLFASGLTTPNGMAFRPKRYSDAEVGVGDLFVAETQAGEVSEFALDGVRHVFATGGNPKFLAFELILPGKLLNISTRLDAKTGDNVLIGGFIVAGDVPKEVLLRAIGPSLSDAVQPVAGALQDTVLELHKPDGSVVVNDDWKSDQKDEIEDTGIAPTDDRESAIRATLEPGIYTAIVRGKDDTTGVAMVEAYDLEEDSASELANISTRGLVESGDDCMIGGFIVQPSESARVLIRAIGASLADAEQPILNPLADPFLELHDADGVLINSNDNWADTAEGEISATGAAPTKVKESAILANLRGGNYTAIVRGTGDSVGVALVEVYHLP